MARPVDVERKRAEILAGARRAFAARGFNRATVDEVAAAAGVAKGTVYLYFKTKQDLADALFDEHFSALEAGLDRIRDLPDEPGALREALGTLLQRAPASADVVRVYFEMLGPELAAGESPLLDRARRFFDALSREIARVLTRLQKKRLLARDIAPVAFARMLVTALDGLILHEAFFRTNRREFRQSAEQLLRLIR